MAHDFVSFKDATRAIFAPCDPPSRKPDHESDSGSQYWNVGNGVVRKSNHWSGIRGCEDIRSCWWEIETENKHQLGELTGFCAYDQFVTRDIVPVWHVVTDTDRMLAKKLSDVGAIPKSDWSTGSGRNTRPIDVPAWAACVSRHAAMVGHSTLSAQILAKNRIRVQRIITAERKLIRGIVKGNQKIKIGEKYA